MDSVMIDISHRQFNMSDSSEVSLSQVDIIERALADQELEFERHAGEIIEQETIGVCLLDVALELLSRIRKANPGMLCTLVHRGDYYRVALLNVRQLSGHSSSHRYAVDRRDVLRDWAFTRQHPELVKLWNSGMIEDFDTALVTADFLHSSYPDDCTVFAPKRVFGLWCLVARTYQLTSAVKL